MCSGQRGRVRQNTARAPRPDYHPLWPCVSMKRGCNPTGSLGEYLRSHMGSRQFCAKGARGGCGKHADLQAPALLHATRTGVVQGDDVRC